MLSDVFRRWLRALPDARAKATVEVTNHVRHCERSEAIQGRTKVLNRPAALDCFALLAMTARKAKDMAADLDGAV
jgi:hypothetical protein